MATGNKPGTIHKPWSKLSGRENLPDVETRRATDIALNISLNNNGLDPEM